MKISSKGNGLKMYLYRNPNNNLSISYYKPECRSVGEGQIAYHCYNGPYQSIDNYFFPQILPGECREVLLIEMEDLTSLIETEFMISIFSASLNRIKFQARNAFSLFSNWTTYFDIYDEFGFKTGKYYRFKIVL